MTNEMHIIPLLEISVAKSITYGDLPDEAAFNRVAELRERAERCNRSFVLVNLKPILHRIGLCVALTDTADTSIAIFYVADGTYAWYRRSLLHVFTESSTQWTAIPVKVGMHYCFDPSNHGPGHVLAKPWGTAGRLKEMYFQQHSQPSTIKASGNKKKSGSDDSEGAPPVLHPTSDDFVPVKSLDDLGL
jgi:hypothetical protein